jgi:hypothetical protein
MIDGQRSSSMRGPACTEEARPWLGFRGGDAHRGRQGQARAGIGHGGGEEGRRNHRSCMQGLGVRAYSSGVRASTVMASSTSANLEANEGKVRFR